MKKLKRILIIIVAVVIAGGGFAGGEQGLQQGGDSLKSVASLFSCPDFGEECLERIPGDGDTPAFDMKLIR